MSEALQGRVALVTGASKNIGKGIALEVAASGAVTYVTARSVEDVPGRPTAGEESTREFAARMRGATADPELDPAEARASRAVRLARALHRDPRQRS